MEKIILTNGQGSHVILLQDIVYCEAQGCYSFFYLSDGSKKIISKTLKTFEGKLCANGFTRVHRKYIVNMEHIRHFDHRGKGRICLGSGTAIPISHRRKKQFNEIFRQYLLKR